MKASDKVECIDGEGWLISEPRHKHFTPRKGEIYVIREYTTEFGVGAISLMEGNQDDFYRACRFRPVAEVGDTALAAGADETASSNTDYTNPR